MINPSFTIRLVKQYGDVIAVDLTNRKGNAFPIYEVDYSTMELYESGECTSEFINDLTFPVSIRQETRMEAKLKKLFPEGVNILKIQRI
jgi:hypothetical protein